MVFLGGIGPIMGFSMSLTMLRDNIEERLKSDGLL